MSQRGNTSPHSVQKTSGYTRSRIRLYSEMVMICPLVSCGLSATAYTTGRSMHSCPLRGPHMRHGGTLGRGLEWRRPSYHDIGSCIGALLAYALLKKAPFRGLFLLVFAVPRTISVADTHPRRGATCYPLSGISNICFSISWARARIAASGYIVMRMVTSGPSRI